MGAQLSLFFSLFLCKWSIDPVLIDRNDSVQKSVSNCLPKAKVPLKITRLIMVKEEPPNPSFFFSMRNVENTLWPAVKRGDRFPLQTALGPL